MHVYSTIYAFDRPQQLDAHSLLPPGGRNDCLWSSGFEGRAENRSTNIIDEDRYSLASRLLSNDFKEFCLRSQVGFPIFVITVVTILIKIQVAELPSIYWNDPHSPKQFQTFRVRGNQSYLAPLEFSQSHLPQRNSSTPSPNYRHRNIILAHHDTPTVICRFPVGPS